MERYDRVGMYPINKILHLFFTKTRHKQFSLKSQKGFIRISPGKHKYQLFAKKGIKCCLCGIEGTYFAAEKLKGTKSENYHLNLYGLHNGEEIMITKDHIIPRSRGGKSCMDNYQVLCQRCNLKKGNNLKGLQNACYRNS